MATVGNHTELQEVAKDRIVASLLRRRDLLLPCLLGFTVYALITRFRGLWPGDTEWLLPYWNSNIDSATHYLGWEFFRQAPLLQWPLGRSPNLGPGLGSSIAMTDSIPFFALIFKPLTFWFSSPFQYFGIWTLTCFVLQAVFGWKLLSLWIVDRIQLLLGTAFLVISPIFIDRLSFHFALAGHWVLIAALYLYFTEGHNYLKWLIVGCIATLVQPYLAMMVTVLYLADVARQSIRLRRLTYGVSLRIIGYFAVLLATAWQSGLFVFGLSSTSALGFDTYSANGLTFVDPGHRAYFRPLWSSFVPDVMQGKGQYEGFNYLGSGLIVLSIALFASVFLRAKFRSKFLIAVALVAVPILGPQGKPIQKISVLLLLVLGTVTWMFVLEKFKLDGVRTVSICVAALLLSVYSLSNRVFLGDLYVATYPIPGWFLGLVSRFRASGRALWPVTYLLSTLIISSVFLRYKKMLAVALVSVCLIFQMVESRHAIAVTAGVFSRNGPDDPYPAPLWNVFGERFSRIDVVLPTNKPHLSPTNPDFVDREGRLWRDLGTFALAHHLKLNSFYFARVPTVQLAQDAANLITVVETGNYRSDTLYVFIDSDMWESAKANHRATDLVGILDDIPIVAPGLADCEECDFTNFLSLVRLRMEVTGNLRIADTHY